MDARDLLFEQRMNDMEYLRELFRSGRIGGLNQYERELLEFCHNTDMPKYLKENVGDKPIVLDENGNIDRERTKFQSSRNSYGDNPYYGPNTYQQPMYQQPVMPQVTPQKFYYLYDDNGNLIAAIPQR